VGSGKELVTFKLAEYIYIYFGQIITGNQHSLLCRCPVLAMAETSVCPSVKLYNLA